MLSSYRFSIILLLSLLTGAALGLVFKDRAALFKPFGDIFLNLLFTVVVPLVFFSISSAVASMTGGRRLGNILLAMLGTFIATGAAASLLMIAAVKAFPPAQGMHIALQAPESMGNVNIGDVLVKAFTVSDFSELLSKKNMLALIIFSVLIGLGAAHAGERGREFARFLSAANEVFNKVVGYILWYAPVGLGAYFAYLTGVFGPQLFGSYFRAMALYYPLALGYFVIAFSVYACLAAGREGLRRFWTNIIPTSLTALATGSSVAVIPLNLEAAEKSGVPEDIREVVIPIGATIHMDGSCMSAVLKTALLFGIFQMDFAGPGTLLAALAIALLSGTVMSGIPSGGFLGEILIVTLYGFPPEALPIISMIGVLVDPPATMVNAVGDNVCSMMVARILGGPRWMTTHERAS
ncbi:MAG: sodium:proton antiporter [Omnitrophica WOR_2 bacterium RIFCSPHIGHO2_02_FULL_52_10]|nr:MAG: sodium:proton antiporter [Omnitrophica WOR_2 bacterium RIFCSPHIGHO2_02_FULL_52_10]